MDIKLNEINSSEKEIEVTFSYEEIKEDLDKEVKKRIKDIQLPGFRKGKAPLPYLKKIYGDALEYEASEKVANNKFWGIVQERGLNPIDTPVITDIKFEPASDLYFKIRFEVMPQIEIKDYTGFEIELPKVSVSDEDVNYEINAILNSNRELEEAEVVGEDNNYVLSVNMVRLDEAGNVIEGTTAEKLEIDLSNERVQPEIILNSRGKKKGESFPFTFTDERVVKNAEGIDETISQKYFYRADILEIKKFKLPELSEEFIKKVTRNKVSTEEELRKNISDDIMTYLNNQVEELTRGKLIEQIMQNNPFEPPHSMVRKYMDELIKVEEEKAKKQGVKSFNRQEAGKKMHNIAEVELKWHMLKESLKAKENIGVTDEELQDLALKESEKTGITVDKLLNYYNSSGYKNKLSDQKVFDFLKNNNSVKYIEPNEKGKSING